MTPEKRPNASDEIMIKIKDLRALSYAKHHALKGSTTHHHATVLRAGIASARKFHETPSMIKPAPANT
jgi:hypothetical protein